MLQLGMEQQANAVAAGLVMCNKYISGIVSSNDEFALFNWASRCYGLQETVTENSLWNWQYMSCDRHITIL